MRFLSFWYLCLFIFLFRFFFTLSAQRVVPESSDPTASSSASGGRNRNPLSKTGFEANPKGKLGKIGVEHEDPTKRCVNTGGNIVVEGSVLGGEVMGLGDCEGWKAVMNLEGGGSGGFLSSFWSAEAIVEESKTRLRRLSRQCVCLCLCHETKQKHNGVCVWSLCLCLVVSVWLFCPMFLVLPSSLRNAVTFFLV